MKKREWLLNSTFKARDTQNSAMDDLCHVKAEGECVAICALLSGILGSSVEVAVTVTAVLIDGIPFEICDA